MKFIGALDIAKTFAKYLIVGFLAGEVIVIIPALIITFISQNSEIFLIICIGFGILGATTLTLNITVGWIENGLAGNKEITGLLQKDSKQLDKNIWITIHKGEITRIRKTDIDSLNHFITHIHIEILNTDELILKNYIWGQTHMFPRVQEIDSINYFPINSSASPTEGTVSHYFHILPSRIQDDNPSSKYLLPFARIVFSFKHKGNYYLWRLDHNIEDVGDTWHPTLENLLNQAKFEFGINEDGWNPLPTNIKNIKQWREWVEQIVK